MIEHYRKIFNQNFSTEKYRHFLQKLNAGYPPIPFRVAETPIFLPRHLKAALIQAGEEIIKLIRQPGFGELTETAIPKQWNIPGENDHPHFLTFDFGISKNENAELVPKLIEMQGFPSLYGFQHHLASCYQDVFNIENNLSPFFGDFNPDKYTELLKTVILGKHAPQEVVLMDLDAHNQKTRIDFLITQKMLGIKILALEEIRQNGNELYYLENGQPIRIRRLYNRLIFDEIENPDTLFTTCFDPRKPVDVEWITHPNWFYRISKYTMPFLKAGYVPETHFLNSLSEIPADLENYVLKPLFSFAGMGVIIDVTEQDINEIQDPQNWILQRKVHYEPVVQSPDGGVKAEIRLMYLWPDEGEPQLCMNLARLSRGKMIGVRYNQNFDWVGGTVCFME